MELVAQLNWDACFLTPDPVPPQFGLCRSQMDVGEWLWSIVNIITLIYNIDDTMLTASNEQEIASILAALVIHVRTTGSQRPATTQEPLGTQWSGPCQDTLSKAKDTLLRPEPPTMKKKAQRLLGFFLVSLKKSILEYGVHDVYCYSLPFVSPTSISHHIPTCNYVPATRVYL